MVVVKKVTTKKQQKEFLDFPLKLYKDNPYFVPPLYMDEKKIFNKNYVYNNICETVYYNAYKDNKIVGRISAILQKSSNEKWNQKRIRFTRFDSIDDQEVANALFKAVEDFAKEKQMDEVVGPLGFSDLEREGLLIEGFDYISTFEEQYNYPYYQRLIQNCGYTKEVDWIEHRLYYPKVESDRLAKYTDLIFKRFNLHYGKAKNTNEFIKKYAEQFFEIIDITYENLYGTVPFTKEMKKMMIENFKLIVNVKNVAVILDENERVVSFGICFPSLSKAIQKSQGHLTLPTLFRLLHDIKHPKTIDLGLIGVLPEYAMKGVSSALISKILIMLKRDNLEYAETNLTLETNQHILNQWKNFDKLQHKRRRCFIKKI